MLICNNACIWNNRTSKKYERSSRFGNDGTLLKVTTPPDETDIAFGEPTLPIVPEFLILISSLKVTVVSELR